MICYNVKIKTDDSEFIRDTLIKIQSCYNFISSLIYNTEKYDSISIKEIHHLCYYSARNTFPDLPAQIVIRLERQIYANYKSVKSNKHEIIKPLKSKTLSVRLDKRLFSRFTQTSIDLFSSKKHKLHTATFVLYPKIKELLSKYNVGDPTLFSRNSELYLSIPFDIPEPLSQNDNVLGIDRGIRRLMVTSDGLIIKGNEYQHYKRKQNYLKRCIQSKQTKSAKRKLKKVKRKTRNFSNNYCHLVANEILKTDRGVIVLENLRGIKKKTSRNECGIKRTVHNRCFSQIPLKKIQEILTYKAPLLGKRVATVSPYRTSLQDCRGLSEGRRVGCRYYASDNRQLDADINASVNIANRYSRHPAQQYPKGYVLIGRLLIGQSANRIDNLLSGTSNHLSGGCH